ncbi:MAG: dienelactone hydrolase family protein [Flavisolibacter sp.]
MFLFSCSNQNASADKTSLVSADSALIKEENVVYSSDGTSLNGFIAFDSSKTDKKPAVLIVHEWWGLTDYTRNRARQLAKMGYIALAVDMYGAGKVASNPQEAQGLATPFYKDPRLCKTRLDAALTKIKSYSQIDTNKIAAIGYCYGGFVVLNAAKLGADLKGVVSFHGDLSGVNPDKNQLKSKILVCHGASDQFVNPQVDKFKHQMDSIGADYTFKTYPNATHAFTNPGATELGKKFSMPIAYNEQADKASWNDMKDFFGKIFK